MEKTSAISSLVSTNDNWTEAALKLQVNDPSSKYDGGVLDTASGIPRPNHLGTPAVMAAWVASLVNPESRFYHSIELLRALERTAAFMLNRQHADGTVSLGSTNFNSPPDTAFVVGGVSQLYRLLMKDGWPDARDAADRIRLFLERTIPALLTGGVHTPNHRWVITAALAQLHHIFGQPELLARAEQWLNEGMDITEDGEWTERSNGIYNAVSNISLYHTAILMNRHELLEYVRRNLRMMAYLIHPDGEVVTDYSGRQDLGQRADLSNYFLIYRLMAAHDQDPLFAAMADYAEQFVTKFREGVNNQPMVGLLLHPSNIERLERAQLPDHYVKLLNFDHPMNEHLEMAKQVGHHMQIQHSSMHLAFGAPVVRIREKNDSVTLMARTPSFFSLRHGKARLLGVKLATTFSPGVVKFDELNADDRQFTFHTVLKKGYNGPVSTDLLPQLPNRLQLTPWYLLPHQHRQMTHEQKLELSAELVQGKSEWTIRVKSDEREDVFTQLTFVFGAEGTLEGSGLESIAEGRFNCKEGSFSYTAGGERLEISSGAYEHWLPHIPEDQHPAGCQYVHVNLLTPFERKFTIRLL